MSMNAKKAKTIKSVFGDISDPIQRRAYRRIKKIYTRSSPEDKEFLLSKLLESK